MAGKVAPLVALRLLTADPSQTLWELHQQFNGPIPGIEVRRPTLEDTYLGMVGADLPEGSETGLTAARTEAS
ncbi:hypothetical protein GCM10010211_16210 [Streptomyces albospinus]|uniref:ABC transporter ATP-binding protein n=1 Tax=Streptomyces albospinus TaxID=285515 RepID=A0ABQ2UVQ1_9ACTN|nr:hypothetical protein GCM10010211_16210 [Streptomyces albospinus]